MRRPGLLLIAGLISLAGLGVRAPAATPARTVGAAQSAPAQVRDVPAKHQVPARLVKGKSTNAKPGLNTAATATLPKKQTPPGSAAAHTQITGEEICGTVEQAAAENRLPVYFLVRVIWQESRFNPRAISHRGAEGIAQFMRKTAYVRGLGDPFEPVSSIENAASYLDDLRKMFGNLGLAAAGYNAGPGRVREWLDGKGKLPKETRDYVAIITGWTADQWASPSPPQAAATAIPQGVPCARIARLLAAPLPQEWRIAACVAPWRAEFIANWSKARVGPADRMPRNEFATLIGDREPILPRKSLGNLGEAKACRTDAAAPVHEWLDRRRALISVGWSVNQAAPARRAVPVWGAQLTASWSEAGAWAIYRMLQKQFAALIGDREPIIVLSNLPGMGTAPRYMVRIADDNRDDLEKLCDALIAAGGACVVLRNEVSLPVLPPAEKGSG
jgi:hypothetical protein